MTECSVKVLPYFVGGLVQDLSAFTCTLFPLNPLPSHCPTPDWRLALTNGPQRSEDEKRERSKGSQESYRKRHHDLEPQMLSSLIHRYLIKNLVIETEVNNVLHMYGFRCSDLFKKVVRGTPGVNIGLEC